MRSRNRNLIIIFKYLPISGLLYSVLNVSAPIWMLGLLALPVFTGTWIGNPLSWRAFSNPTAHHTLILYGYSVFFFALWRVGKVKPLLAVSALFMLISVHELMWWSTDIVWMQFNGVEWHWYWFFGYLLPPTLGCVMIYPQFVNLPRRLILVQGGVMIAWFAVGFPVTVNYVPVITQWYGTIWGDGWEVLSWWVPLVAFWFLERKGLLRSQSLLTEALQSSTT